jgi:RHS repeat-associated protein
MTDGTGTTAYSYNPYAPYVAGTPISSVPGAGRLASVTGPLTNETIAYTYDELGRRLTRSINGSANTTTVHYDSLGRVDTTTNLLGTFAFAYVGVTDRLDHATYPNGQRTNYGYYPNTVPTGTGNGDQRLQQIQNLTPGGANLSTFGYTYDGSGLIQTWSRQSDAASALTSSFKYDALGQLLSATVPTSASVVKQYTYGYDVAGNRIQEQIDNGLTTSVPNNLNQLTGQTPGGPMEFAGTVNEPSIITIGGAPTTVDAAGNWRGKATVSPGSNAIPLVATDASGNATTKTIQITVPGGATRTLTYDLNGNEINNGAGRVTELDALNHPVKVTIGANVTEFVYDGHGQRVQEKLNGVLVKQWVWAGGGQPAEELDAAGNVTKRFFGAGEQIAGTNYYFTTDHIGSIREMTDGSGAVRARYEYDAWGRSTKISGDMESDFGYAGMFRDQATGLWRTKYRLYDPELARWTTRDPSGIDGGLNLYTYVGNNPINFSDPLGLQAVAAPVGTSPIAYNIWRGPTPQINIGGGPAFGGLPDDIAGWLPPNYAPPVNGYPSDLEFRDANKPQPFPFMPPPGPPRPPKGLGASCPNSPNGDNEENARGREAHKWWVPPDGFDKEQALLTGRADAINYQTREILELKPNNPDAIRLGQQQLQRYIQDATIMYGGKWTGRVVTY